MFVIRPQKLSVLLGTYLSLSILFFSSSLLLWAYKTTKDLAEREMKCRFLRQHNIAQSSILKLCETVEKSLTTIRSNPSLLPTFEKMERKSEKKFFISELLQELGCASSPPLDILFIHTPNRKMWYNGSSGQIEYSTFYDKIIQSVSDSSLEASIQIISVETETFPVAVKALPIFHMTTGDKIGMIYGGILIENNSILMERIKRRAEDSFITLFKNGNIIGSTEKAESLITKTIINARKKNPPNAIFLSKTPANEESDEMLIQWKPLVLNGKESAMELAVGIPNTLMQTIQITYVRKGIFLFLFSTLFLFFTIYLIKKLTFTPLTNLLEYADTIASGNLSVTYNDSFVKEYNRIGSSMEQMVQRLSQTNKQLLADIAKRKAYEKALNESKERYRTLHDNVQVAVYRITPRGKIIAVNQSGVEMAGYPSKEALLRCNVKYLFRNSSYQTALFERLKKERKLRGYECCFRKKDGNTFWGSVNAVMVFDEEDIPVYVDGILEDITKKKETEKEKEKYQQRLRQIHKMEAIGTLAGGIAHDFNNILSAIIGYTEMATDLVEPDSVIHDYLSEIFKGGIRASNLVKQILTFSRQGDHDIQPLQIKNIVHETLKLLRPSLPSTIEIHLNLNDNPTIMADPTQIHQIIINLVTNASHAMEKNGGILNIETHSVDLSEDFATQHPHVIAGAYCKLTVQDTGCGMSTSITERIFYPFFTTKEKGKGTGMGLSVVHGIVKKHKGFITVFSERSVGSTFNVFFPIAKVKNTLFSKADQLIPRGGEHIMLVDDEKIIAKMGKKMLESLGYHVQIWHSSEEALQFFRKNPDQFDLVITDMTMPKMTGKEIAKEMIRIRANLPIILCTGFSSSIDENEAKEIGIKAFIFKPILKPILAATIRKILDQSRLN